MIGSIWDNLIATPIFNLLVFVYGIIPGHNFGLSIIVFTIIVRILMWPIIKKQLHQTKAMRKMQPEIKKIKQAAKGNRQQESMMLMELYKERGISPMSSLGTMIIQIIILFALYHGLNRVVQNPQAIIEHAYGWLKDLPWLKTLASDITRFDASLFGIIDLNKAALPKGGGVYIPALLIVLASAVAQFYQSKQLMPKAKDQRSLRTILKEANTGNQADQSEINAAVGQSTRWLLPVMIIFFTIGLPAALGLYWLVSGLVAYWQQARILGQDEEEMEAIADKPSRSKIIEGEVVEKPKRPKKKTTKKRRR